jgi:uncharacterized protein with von Willebrand factor type A (vWA) domain
MSRDKRQPGGIIHTYRKYDPQRFPMPAAEPPDLVSPAFEHMLTFGTMRHLSPEDLAEAVEIDPSQIQGLGPSIESLRALLEERKRKILQTYETDAVRHEARQEFERAGRRIRPPQQLRKRFEAAVRSEQVIDLERLWYRAEQRGDFARQLLLLKQRLIDRDEIEELAQAYAFTGRTPMSIPKALEIKEELETIDRLLKQLEEAARNAKVYLIDMEALSRYADEEQVEGLERIRRQIEELLRRQAEQQGLLDAQGELQLTPRAYKVFQGKLLDRIFSELQAARSGRHMVELSGDGAVELQRTKSYEFGDSLANMDVPNSLINALLREATDADSLPLRAARVSDGPPRVRLKPEDIEIHLTRNNPKCATCVLMDMSGSMQWGGLYVDVKRMALALHGLIRREYPGDFLDFIEIATLAKRRHVGEIVELLPKPVTIRDPVVRLRADLSDPDISEFLLPPHFTNIQHGLRLARQALQAQDTPNRQIILITDGLPTAHFEGHDLYMLYPPHERTAEHTMREGLQCRAQGIVINIFLLSTWAQSPEDVQFAHKLAESTAGRVFFVGGRELDRFVVWDYVRRRRQIIG